MGEEEAIEAVGEAAAGEDLIEGGVEEATQKNKQAADTSAGGNPFLHPGQNLGEASWSHPGLGYGGQPSREMDQPYVRGPEMANQSANRNFFNPRGQGRGPGNHGGQQYPPFTPPYPPQNPQPPYPPQNPKANSVNHQQEFQNRGHTQGGNFNNFNQNVPYQSYPGGHFNPNQNRSFHPPQFSPPNSQYRPNFDPRFHTNAPMPPRQQLEQENYGMNPGLEMPRSKFGSETNLHRVNSVGSLNSERSLNLNLDHCSRKDNTRRQRNSRNKSKNKFQNDLTSNPPTNAYMYDKTHNFRGMGRGKGRSKGPGGFSGTSACGVERPLSRSSSVSNDPYMDFENLNLNSDSGAGTKRFNNRSKNFRGRGKRSGGPGTDCSQFGERPLSKSSFTSDNSNCDFNNLEENVPQDESYQTGYVQQSDIGNQQKQNKKKTKETRQQRQNKPQNKQNKPKLPKSSLTIEMVEKLRQQDPMEIVRVISENESEYLSLLREDHDARVLIVVVDILGKICDTPSSQSKVEILRQAALPAFTFQLFECITEYPYIEDGYFVDHANQFFENTISLFETLSDFMPSAARVWHNNITEITKSLKVMAKNPKMELNPYLIQKAKHLLDEVGQDLKEEKEVNEVKKQENKKECYFPEPVGDFRTVSLYPRPDDIFGQQPFLYPNIISGPYRSVDHYLDTHFKLLREDFMSPIRYAMKNYKNQCNTKNRFKRVDNVRIYRKVKFLTPKTVFDTVGYEICFDVDNKMNRVNWEFCSRFLDGSLLLFTNDDFDSFFMATVLTRNVKELQEKLVTVELVEKVENMKSILGKEFVMAESEAYFKPYFQVLKALQRFNETNFPLAQYIVRAETETQPPRYLNFAEIYSIKMAGQNFSFRVLSNIEWPTHEQVGLDRSQYDAFKAALTNDLTVIQGPPGTGKTFLGLKIAQALLNNEHVWNHENTPIFVVCFTNHALDQFLEGLLPVTTKLVRIGGKNKGGELDKFNIRERRKEHSYYRDKTTEKKQMQELKMKMSPVFADIQVYQNNLKAVENTVGVISIKTLQFVMSEEQRNTFQGDDDFMGWLLAGVSAAGRNTEKVKITITADRGVVREVPTVDPATEDAEDRRVQQAFFDTIDLDTSVGPSEDTITVQFACDLEGLMKKRDALLQQLNSNIVLHRTQLLQMRSTCESLDLTIKHLSNELKERYRKYPQSDFEKERLLGERNIQNLPPNDRWKLYNTWCAILRDGLIVTLANKDTQYKDLAFQYEQLQQSNDLKILRTANVVGTTTTLAAKYKPMFEALSAKIVIVEEAAEVLEAHILASLSRSCQHLILIGDHKQLRPTVAEPRMARQYKLDVSLFERLVLNDMACHTLTLQHRMRPEISRQLVPTIYPVLRDDPSVMGRDNIKGMDKNVFFMTHNHFEDEVVEITSKRNTFEAGILLGLARYLVQQGYKPQEITILATYKGQMYHMKNEIKNMNGFPKGIQITVVDNFQGEENKIILLSLVRSNAVKKIGFLEIENRICVALSRARDGLYIVGNMNCLSANSEIWVKIRNSLAQQNCYGSALTLRCQIHKEQKTKIESAQDFSKVAEGGCSLLCGQPLPCGHFCKSMCHVEQDYHLRYKCKDACPKILCAEGHQCPKKCHQQCGPCMIPMRRELGCGHFADVPCHMDVREHPCTEKVQVLVPFCRHVISVPCHERLHPVCNLPCTRRLECGHSCELTCHETDDPDHLDYACMKPCARLNKNCSLDHKCEMACFEECKPCPEKVMRMLLCGHELKIVCSADLGSIECKQKCERTMTCGHPCTKKCNQDCQPCTVLVKKRVRGCNHEIEIACSTAPMRQYCTGKCTNVLGCGHQCSKRCMDPCSENDCVQPVLVEEKMKPFSLFPSSLTRKKPPIYPLLCGHNEARVPCNKKHLAETMSPAELMQYCSTPCGTELTCGHVCSGTCSECLQGRIHKVCDEQCGNVLICGHSCKVPCREVCPPCKEPCRHECKHSKCSRKCGETCVSCKEPCDYTCQHLRCTKRCGEPCDRKPCYEECHEPLDCGHFCVGFCGEPCPPCRQCEPLHFEEIFYTGEETEEDSKWVLLVDCGHTLESTGLEMWLNVEQENGEIGCKVCPRCKTPIVKVQRFMNLIKQTYTDIQSVKEKAFGKRDEIVKERAQALRKIQNVNFVPLLCGNETTDELGKMFRELQAELPEVKGKKRNTIDAQRLRLLCFWTEFFISVYNRRAEVWSKLDEESKQKLNSNINSLCQLLMKRKQKISEQEMQGFERELKRIHRMADLYVYVSSVEYRMASSYSGAKQIHLAAEEVIFSIKAYDKELDNKAKMLLGTLKDVIRSSTELSAEEKAMINKAMSSNFSSYSKTGHWFKCKNGHTYCITECGGAMEEAKCPIKGCDDIIGGQQHRLRDNQILATDMDGARHAAWSDANNMANYRF